MTIDKDAIKAEAQNIAKGVALLDVEMVDIDKLVPYENNSKVHDKNHIERLAANIKTEGLQESLLIEEDHTIVAGHGRQEALRLLGWKQVPVRIMRGYTKAQCMIHRVSSNLTVSTKYDSTKQAEELSEIQALYESEDLSLESLAAMTGYSERDIEVLSEDLAVMDDFENVDFDAIDEEPATEEKSVSKGEDEETVVKTVSLSKLFGFNDVTPEIARSVRKFVALADIDSPKSFEDFCKGFVMAAESE